MKPNSAFAENMVSHSVNNTAICCNEMQLFCKYIALLSQKPLEVQKIFLDTFPPKKREDIACLGGTGSRMSDLTDQLQVSKEDGPFIETHKLLMSQLIDRFKFYVPDNFHVHIPQFLNHSFSIESPEALAKKDPCFSYPSFYMPAHILWEGIRAYDSQSKKILKKNEALINNVQDAAQLLDKELKSCDLKAALYDYETKTGKEARSTILDKSGEIPVSELVDLLEKDGKDKFVWSLEKIVAAAVRKIWTKHKAPNAEKSISKQQGLIDEISSGSSIFKGETVDKLVKLIKSDDRRDVQVAVESIWIMGSKMKGNSPLQFMRTINAIGKADNIKYLQDEVRAKVLPNHQLKLDKIIQDYNSYSKNQVIIKRLTKDESNRKESELAVLVSIGATTEEIKDLIQDCGNKCLSNIYSFGESFIANLINRPDCLEIIKAIKDKNIEFPSSFKKELLLKSVYYDQSEISLYVLNNFELESEILKDPEILTRALASKNKEVAEIIIKKGGKRYLDFKSNIRTLIDGKRYSGLAPIHSAAIRGDEDVILALKEQGADMNLRTGANIFYPNSWQPVNPFANVPLSNLLNPFDLPFIPLELGAKYLGAAGGYLFSQTPMHLAASNGKTSAINALIKSGSEIDLPCYLRDNSISLRPLHCAIAGGYKAAAEALIEAGASLESKSVLEPSPASIAVRYNQPHCLELLIEKEAKIEPAEMNHLAQIAYIYRLDNEILNLLVRNGAFMPNILVGNSNPLIKSSKTFEMVATAIMENATAEIVNPTPESRKELTKLHHEIYKTLIKTYDFKEVDLIEDLSLGSGMNGFDFKSFKKDILGKENIQKIGQILKERINTTTVEGSMTDDSSSLYKRIFSHTSAPKQNVNIERAEELLTQSLQNRDNITTILTEIELKRPNVEVNAKSRKIWPFSSNQVRVGPTLN